jgi:AraC family transcriptional regulator
VRGSSRVEYETRLDRVISYIDAHVAEELSLDTLARRAALSPYHFHRVFRALTGEPLGVFVQRRRLEKAARELHQRPRAKVLEVALRHGYESTAAFTRAFQKHFGVGPAKWRKESGEVFIGRALERKARSRAKNSKLGKEIAVAVWQKLTSNEASPAPTKAHVEVLPKVSAVRMRYVGPYGSLEITKMWDDLMRRADEAGLVGADTTCVGVVHDDPAITPKSRCRYDACVVVPEARARGAMSIGGLPVTAIEGGRHLAFPFLGQPSDVDPAWDAVYAALPDSGYAPASRPNLEWYPPGSIVDPVKMIFRCKLCVALRPF